MKKLIFIFAFVVAALTVFAQNKQAGPHDFGRMWTFENPPTEWFSQAYDFNPGDDWFDFVRLSALRMNTGCSASFVSPDGLVMTNHHCSRDVALAAQEEGEDIMKNGFVAYTREDERPIKGVFFEQLIKCLDVTDMVKNYSMLSGAGDEESKRAAALDSVRNHFRKMDDWQGLRIQITGFYSGLKYSAYGYKRFDNVKLVAIPESDVAFFGGDPDNFTYPRYSLDFTFFRVYDENDIPFNSSDHYYRFNAEGPIEGEPVFVVGNPGTTERYRTVAQLDYDRKHRYPVMIDVFRRMLDRLQEQYDQEPSERTMNMIFMIANGHKAYSGIQSGLMDDELFGRKVEIENMIRKDYKGDDHWHNLVKEYEVISPYSWAMILLNPMTMGNSLSMFMFAWNRFEQVLISTDDEDEIEIASDNLRSLPDNLNTEDNVYSLSTFLALAEKYIPEDNRSLRDIQKDMNSEEFTRYIVENSSFFAEDGWKHLLELDPDELKVHDDPFLRITRALMPQYSTATELFNASAPKRKIMEENVARAYFEYFGDILPPDATFTLRISDGRVSSYDYNGTQAPYKTTFYGMYDRYFSFNKEFPWSLPELWLDPPLEFLSKPINFVSTNDITGGNSGSPIINRNKEVVGLIFDGNIESLPGNFIFDEESNRSVSVHTGGILASLKYIYKAEKLVKELAPSYWQAR
jgi:hypothetical protein